MEKVLIVWFLASNRPHRNGPHRSQEWALGNRPLRNGPHRPNEWAPGNRPHRPQAIGPIGMGPIDPRKGAPSNKNIKT